MNTFATDQGSIVFESTLICPECKFEQTTHMPVDACQFFFECANCHAMLRPLPGDCCVFCSYGDVPCPPVQQHQACCQAG